MIIRITDDLLQSNSRHPRWGKIIHTTEDVDLRRIGGYSLKSRFLNWDEAASICPGQYLVVAVHAGTRRGYACKLYLAEGGELRLIDDNEIDTAIIESSLAEPIKVASMNSRLHAYASYAYLKMKEAGLYPDRMEEDHTVDRLLDQVFGDRI